MPQAQAPSPAQINANFLRYSFARPAKMLAQNNPQWSAGTTLQFINPVMQGAFAERIRVFCNLTVNYTAAGANPTVSMNAAGPLALIQRVTVTYGNEQIVVHPYVLKVLSLLNGYNRQAPGQIIGTQNSTIQGMLESTNFTFNAGNNTWKFFFDIPLRAVSPLIYGMLPISGTGTQLQLSVQCAPSATGADPLLNAISTNGTIAVSGSITPVIVYRDFLSMNFSNHAIAPILDGLPTAQIIQPMVMNPLTAGIYNNKRFANPYPFVKIVAIVIDGQSSGTFCAADNIQGFRLDQAENDAAPFMIYDSTTGGGNDLDYYYSDVRDHIGQDLDSGVLFYDPTLRNVTDPSLRTGDAYLNLAAGDPKAITGYPAARMGVKVGTVGDSGTTGITPRVETFAVILNPQGVKAS